MSLDNVIEVVQQLALTTGTNSKQTILRRHAEDPGFKDFLKFAFNPYMKTNIGLKKLRNTPSTEVAAYDVSMLDIIMYYKFNTGGSVSDVMFAHSVINQQSTAYGKDIVIGLITQTLKLGITATTLNKVYGADFIPKVGVMLAQKYKNQKNKDLGPLIATEKLDGHRRIFICKDGVVNAYTRSGIRDPYLAEIESEVALLPDNTVYDGECIANGTFTDCIALRQATASIMLKKSQRTGVTLKIFDMVTLDSYITGKSKFTCDVRKKRLGSLFGDKSIDLIPGIPTATTFRLNAINYKFKHIMSVPILGIVYTEEEIMALAQPIWDIGGEGIMLNTLKGFYEIKRSKHILKVKHTESVTLTIIGTEEGGGKYVGTLGAIVVVYKGNEVRVGSGFSDYQRDLYWVKRGRLIGLKAEIDTFGESTSNGNISLNCPIFKRIEGEII